MSELDRYILVEEYGETVGTYLNSFSRQEPGYFYTVELYEQIQNYYEGEVPQEVQEAFVQDPYRDYILENLQSHNWEQFYKKLCSTFGIELELWGTTPSEDVDFFTVRFPGPLTSREKKECEELAKFFRYLPTFYGSLVEFEPEYTEKVDVTEDSYGFLYHVMPLRDRDDLKDVESVEKNGFRLRSGRLRHYEDPKTGKRRVDKYRNFTPRVYAYNIGRKLGKTEEEQKRQFRNLLRMKGLTWDKCAIFAIDIQHFPGNFYRDSVVSAGNAVYTYQNIPADRITRIH